MHFERVCAQTGAASTGTTPPQKIRNFKKCKPSDSIRSLQLCSLSKAQATLVLLELANATRTPCAETLDPILLARKERDSVRNLLTETGISRNALGSSGNGLYRVREWPWGAGTWGSGGAWLGPAGLAGAGQEELPLSYNKMQVFLSLKGFSEAGIPMSSGSFLACSSQYSMRSAEALDTCRRREKVA